LHRDGDEDRGFDQIATEPDLSAATILVMRVGAFVNEGGGPGGKT
jgi:hypothetical protein